RVAGLVGGAPEVEANRLASRDQLGGHQLDRSAPRAHVADALVAAQLQAFEDLRPDDELAAAGRVREAGRAEQHDKTDRGGGGPESDVKSGENHRDREEDKADAGEREENVGSVESVVALAVRQRCHAPRLKAWQPSDRPSATGPTTTAHFATSSLR